MQIDMTFSCPSCGGYVAFWAIRRGRSCPFCNVVLKSNADAALRRSIIVGLVVAVVTAFLLGALTGKWGVALVFGPELGAAVGVVVGLLFLRFSLSLWVAPDGMHSNNRVEPTR